MREREERLNLQDKKPKDLRRKRIQTIKEKSHNMWGFFYENTAAMTITAKTIAIRYTATI